MQNDHVVSELSKHHDKLSKFEEKLHNYERSTDKEILSFKFIFEKINASIEDLSESIKSLSEETKAIKEAIKPLLENYEKRKKISAFAVIHWFRLPVIILALAYFGNYLHDVVLNLPSPAQKEELQKLKDELARHHVIANK